MRIGIFGTSTQDYEKRKPLHPQLFNLISKPLKDKLFFERDYGHEYGLSNSFFEKEFGGVYDRDNLFSQTDLWVLPKPTFKDFKHFSDKKILFGWPHCVQGIEITDALVENNMTAIAWESMYAGNDNIHIFQTNNEIAGYAAVHHAMSVLGKSGYFGSDYNAAVLGFGSTARGAIHGLQTLGFNDIDIFSSRDQNLINAPVPGLNYHKMEASNSETLFKINDKILTSEEALQDYNIIVNCVLQDPLQPIMFTSKDKLNSSSSEKIIIDVSCDKGMAFDFANPTSFDNPINIYGNIKYYSVSHTPSYYYDAATYEITKSILPFLYKFIDGSWRDCDTIQNAIEIENGTIKNKKIIKFRERQL